MKSINTSKYIPVIGLEVHAQLSLHSKMFAPEPAAYGALPNTLVSAVSLAHPGTLPTINKKAIEYAIKLGLACKSTITHTNYFARKNYFYPDLPKGYQITQDTTPICQGGYIPITTSNHAERNIQLQRIHLEEDAGKSIHDMAVDATLLDFNRAGVALLEIVTCPDLATPEEAYAFLTELRRLVRYLEICDGNMEEGSLRCDANISIMPRDSETFGQKVEIKNMNSIKNVQLAIAYEIERQVQALEGGEKVLSETRSYDASTGKTISQRTKGSALDYRYFIEPDLPPLVITEDWITQVKNEMPLLPREYQAKFIEDYKISAYAANVLIESKEMASLFESLCQLTTYHTAAANWLMGPVKAYLNELSLPLQEFPLSVATLVVLIELVGKDELSFSAASQHLFPALLAQSTENPLHLAQQLNLLQEKNTDTLLALVEEVIQAHPTQVAAYRQGKKGLLGLFMGEIMQKSQGKAAPALVSKLLKDKLDN
eukprot:gene324-415_t